MTLQKLQPLLLKRIISKQTYFSGLSRKMFSGSKVEFSIPFAQSKLGPFYQNEPRLKNVFEQDVALKIYLQNNLPQQVYKDIKSDLSRFGERVVTHIDALGRQCDIDLPRLQKYDAWGNRVDIIHTCNAWKQMHDLAATEGLIANAYDGRYGRYSRMYQMIKMYLYSPSAGLYNCPLAMTDGAVKVIKSVSGWKDKDYLVSAYGHLTSRDPEQFWTSGQWMTERQGGSDVGSSTETVAVHDTRDEYQLYGYKWFTSATDSNMAFTLARIVDHTGAHIQGSGGLSMFYVDVRDPTSNKLNNIEVIRLKDKLGTRQVPTAELLLDGTRARLVGEVGRGIKCISDILTVTRIHCAAACVAAMRRILMLSVDYCGKRKAFGRPLSQHPLHMQTLARMEVSCRGSLVLLLEVLSLLGLQECGQASPSELDRLRVLTPLLKLYTGKQGVSVISEGLESFGGAGYLEDTGLPGMLRDIQVNPIWEGTTNILSLDAVRSLIKTKCELLNDNRLISKVGGVESCSEAVQSSVTQIQTFLTTNSHSPHVIESAARDISYSITRTYIAALLIDEYGKMLLSDHVSPSDKELQRQVVIRWCAEQRLNVLADSPNVYNEKGFATDTELLMPQRPDNMVASKL